MRKHRRTRELVMGLVIGLVALSTSMVVAAADPVPPYALPGGEATEPIQTTPPQLIGPIDLAAEGQPGWQSEFSGLVDEPPIDVPGSYSAIRGARFDLVDSEGNPLDHDVAHLHHFVLAFAGRQDPACPGREVQGYPVSPHLGTGAERTPIVLPDPYAFKVGDNVTWATTYHVMNMSAEPQTVYLKYTLDYQAGRTDDNTRWVTPWFLDVSNSPDNCMKATYDVPGDGGPDSTHERTRSWTMPEDGIIVGTGGHLHDAGVATELRAGDDSLICRSEVDYGGHLPSHGMHIQRIVPCMPNHRVRAGEQLTLQSFYDNSQPHSAVMGINLTFIWFGNQATGAPAFADVPADHTFIDEVTWAASEGITNGYGDGGFHPADTVSRQAMVAFLHRLAGSPPAALDAPTFSDVPPAHPFRDAVAWAAGEGIVQGDPGGTFRPSAPVSRQALIAFLHRFAGSPAPSGPLVGISDVPVGHPFADAIAWAVGEGILNGYPDGTMRPTSPVTRQAATAALYRLRTQSHLADAWQTFLDYSGWTV